MGNLVHGLAFSLKKPYTSSIRVARAFCPRLFLAPMKTYKYILFDLDDTLVDPKMEILSSARYALMQFGIDEPETEKLQHFATVPLLECFEQEFGFSHEAANRAFQHYWHYFTTFGPHNNVRYDGILELLERLTEAKKILSIATARGTENAKMVVRACGMEPYFDQVVGSNQDMSRTTKRMVIFDLLCHYPEHHSESVVMIGDRPADIVGAKDNDIDSIAVTYGAGTEKELRAANPTVLVHNVEELENILLDPTP